MIETKGVEIPRNMGTKHSNKKTKEELKLRLEVLFEIKNQTTRV
jgi:hypothetical protein